MPLAVLFAYRATEQQSMLESLFFLLCRRDPRLLTEAVLCSKETGRLVNLKEYDNELTEHMSIAWKQAKEKIMTAQKHQKSQYDRKARPPKFVTGDRVFLYKPAVKRSGEEQKLARPYHGPYRITEMNANNAQIRRVDQPDGDLLLVVTDRSPDPLPRNKDVITNKYGG